MEISFIISIVAVIQFLVVFKYFGKKFKDNFCKDDIELYIMFSILSMVPIVNFVMVFASGIALIVILLIKLSEYLYSKL